MWSASQCGTTGLYWVSLAYNSGQLFTALNHLTLTLILLI